MSNLKVQRQAFRAAMNKQRHLVPGEDATRANLGEAFPPLPVALEGCGLAAT